MAYTFSLRQRYPRQKELMSKEASAALYTRWRKTIPFTDEQIACALEESARLIMTQRPGDEFIKERYARSAAWVRKGHITSAILGIVLPILIRTCSLCGKKALYRYGCEGRCRDHRLDAPQPYLQNRQARLKREDARASLHKEVENDLRGKDLRDRFRKSCLMNKGFK